MKMWSCDVLETQNMPFRCWRRHKSFLSVQRISLVPQAFRVRVAWLRLGLFPLHCVAAWFSLATYQRQGPEFGSQRDSVIFATFLPLKAKT